MTFTYSNAGHEPGILLRDNKFIQLDTKGFPVGAYKNSNFEENTITIQNEDLFVFTTDGIIETKISKIKYLEIEDLITSLKNHNSHPKAFINNLNDHLKTFSNNDQLTDDQTIIVAKVNFNISNKTRSKIIKSKEIKVNSDLNNIRTIRKVISELFVKYKIEDNISHDIKLAVNEAHANIIEHAYHGNNNGEIIFKFIIYNDKIEILIRDLGSEFNTLSTKQGINHLEELDGSGLGIYLINTLMDHVEYTSKTIGTEVKLTKYKTKLK